MARFRASEDEHYEPNIWPAVTDAILLMASIFIVLSVVAMMSMAKQLHEYQQEGDQGDQTKCFIVPLPSEKVQFGVGESTFANSAVGKAAIKGGLKALVGGVEQIRASAEAENWAEYYIILEIAGHTDNQPIPGTGLQDGNWRLSSERATRVLDYIQVCLKHDSDLAAKLRVGTGKATPGSTILRAAGYSHHLPISELKNQKENRRIELRLFAQPVQMIQQTELIE